MTGVPLRRVIDTVVGSLCTPFEQGGLTGFLCTRGPRPVTDTLECGHEVTSYNGRRPTRKCRICKPGDPERKAAVSRDRSLLIVMVETPPGWRVEVTESGHDDPTVTETFEDRAYAGRWANRVWADGIPAR